MGWITILSLVGLQFVEEGEVDLVVGTSIEGELFLHDIYFVANLSLPLVPLFKSCSQPTYCKYHLYDHGVVHFG